MPSGRSPPPRLRDRHPPHRIGPIRLRDEFLAQARQPRLHARRLDLREGHPVHARRARIRAGQRIGVAQNVLAIDLVVEQVEAEGGLRLRLTIQLSLKGPDRFRVLSRLIANHLHLAIFESTPEVRVLSSAGITRPQRSYDPVRLPPEPPPDATLRPLPSPGRVSPDYPHHLSDVPCPLPRRIERVHRVDCFPARAAFPGIRAGRHPH